MMKQTPALLFFLLGLALWLGSTSCESQSGAASESLRNRLLGRWEVREAVFQNRPTHRLDGAYLELQADGTLFTNLSGSRQQGRWTLHDRTLEQQLPGLDATYEIVRVEDSLLLLHMQVHDARYKLVLQRPDPAQEKNGTTQ